MISNQYCVIAEFARPGTGGKFDLLGIFDRIYAVSVPAQHRSMFFMALLVTDQEADLGKKQFQLKFRSPNGDVMFEQTGAFDMKPQGGAFLASVRLGFELNGLPLGFYGKHTFELIVDGKPVATHPLQVARPEQPQKP